jgi:nitroimidazol reductase NimA-like FMN-containing flavoprotein (pyridoxamine 5'-phosphate oxidase superfamily)
MPSDQLTRSPLTTVKRKTERASYTRAAANAILDEGLVAHVGIVDDGQPFVIPMVYGRDGDQLLLHGSVASRLLRTLDLGVAVCVTVTLVDALVLARSQFHHSMNYRSVVVLGTARRIRDLDAARRAVACIVDHVVPGRTGEARVPTDAELRQTTVLSLPIATASVKTRTGGPIDEPDDLALPAWAGVMPVTTAFGTPEPAHDLADGVGVPASLGAYERPRGTDRS